MQILILTVELRETGVYEKQVYTGLCLEMYSEPCQTSKMERFA